MNIRHTCRRAYEAPADQKTLAQCESHGADHKAYGWSPQLDSRWSEDQVAAYCRGYGIAVSQVLEPAQ